MAQAGRRRIEGCRVRREKAIVRTYRMAQVIALVVALAAGPVALASGPPAFPTTGQTTSPPKSLVLVVVDAWHGALIGDAKVQLLDRTGKVQFEGVTDAHGRIEASGIPPGRYTLVITARGCDRFERKNFAIPVRGTFEANVQPSGDDEP